MAALGFSLGGARRYNSRVTRSDPDQAAALSLDDPWPEFLDHLDSDPEGAWEGLYIHAWRLVRAWRPPAFARLPGPDQEDLFVDILQDLQEDGFRQLRSYENRGRPFASWFWQILQRRALDAFRAMKRRRYEPLSDWMTEPAPLPDQVVESSEALRDLEGVMAELSPRCQLLLKATAEGYKAKDLVELLSLPADHNKKVADHLKNCRRSLVKAMSRRGYTVRDVL